jgi:hypothetical protein
LLSDHRIQGVAVVPGAYHLASVLSAAGETFGTGPFHLEEITLPEPFVLPAGDVRTVRLSLAQADEGKAAFHVSSRPAVAEDEAITWAVHAAGKVRSAQRVLVWPTREHVPLPAWQIGCQELSANEFCGRLTWGDQVHVGPGFGWIERAWIRENEALGKLRPAGEAEADAAPFHPGLLSDCFRLVCATLPAASLDRPLYLPEGMDRLRFHARAGNPSWCHARLRPAHRGNGEGLTTDIRVLDDAGQPLVEVEGLRLHQAPSQTLRSVL